MLRKLLNTLPNRSSEYPRAVYWALSILLWAIAIAAGIAVLLNSDRLELWKLFLYAALLGAYLQGEKRAHHAPTQAGQRSHEPLRYLLALSWWSLMFGSVLVYALCPFSSAALTTAGALLAIFGSGLRVWSVYTLGQYYSGHIETWTGQTVIQSGPYRLLRHPGYAGSILQVLGMPLVLNAYPALLLSAVVAGLLLNRLLWEEEWLLGHLPGYAQYCQKTWRLLPGIW